MRYYFFSLKTQNIDADLYNANRNKRAKTRDALSMFVNGLSISDMDSVRTQLGMLSMISLQTDEISRSFGVNLNSIKWYHSGCPCNVLTSSDVKESTWLVPLYKKQSLIRLVNFLI